MLTLRPMTSADLPLVRAWMLEPHVAQFYLSGSTIEDELEDLRVSIDGEQPTQVLLVVEGDRSIGWCQWYLCRDYAEHAANVGAATGDVGIDYAIGEPTRIGQGVGTALVAALVEHVRSAHDQVGVIADPAAGNGASRRVLEKNGFELLAVHPESPDPASEPVAIYRLPGRASPLASA